MTWLQLVLRKHGVSQRELADRMGVTESAVSQLVREPNPQVLTLLRIARALGCCLMVTLGSDRVAVRDGGLGELAVNPRADLPPGQRRAGVPRRKSAGRRR